MNRRNFVIALGSVTAGLAAGSKLFAEDAKPAKAPKAPKVHKHSCKGKNACKGQGGCKGGDAGCAGKNTCKGKGGCRAGGQAGGESRNEKPGPQTGVETAHKK